MKAIWKRELQGYFCTAAGYVYLFVFLTVSSVLFYLEILSQRSGELPTFIGEMSYLWMLLSPVLTMRLLAEEKQKKTDQLLLTSPVSLPRIVLGKYLAAVTVLLLATGLTLFYVGKINLFLAGKRWIMLFVMLWEIISTVFLMKMIFVIGLLVGIHQPLLL